MNDQLGLTWSYIEDIRREFSDLGEAPRSDSDQAHEYIERVESVLLQVKLAREAWGKATPGDGYPDRKEIARVTLSLMEGKLHSRIVEASSVLSKIVPSLQPYKESSFARSLECLKKAASADWADEEARAGAWWEIAHLAAAAEDNETVLEALRTVEGLEHRLALEATKKRQQIEALLVQARTDEEAEPKSSCFIATAAFGGAYGPEVSALRSLRDDYLARFVLGRVAIAVYEKVSSPLANLVLMHPWLRSGVRAVLRFSLKLLITVGLASRSPKIGERS